MADQASVTAVNGRAGLDGKSRTDRAPDGLTPESGAGVVARSVAGFGEDLLNLAELQARLSAVELRQNVQAVQTGGAIIAAGLTAIVAGLPVALIGLAELLVSELGFKRGYAFLTVALVATLIGGVSAGVAAARLRRKRLGFPMSLEELARNVHWIRTVLRQSGRLSFRR